MSRYYNFETFTKARWNPLQGYIKLYALFLIISLKKKIRIGSLTHKVTSSFFPLIPWNHNKKFRRLWTASIFEYNNEKRKGAKGFTLVGWGITSQSTYLLLLVWYNVSVPCVQKKKSVKINSYNSSPNLDWSSLRARVCSSPVGARILLSVCVVLSRRKYYLSLLSNYLLKIRNSSCRRASLPLHWLA